MWFTDKLFWKSALNRAIRSVAQGALTGIGASAIMSDVDWKYVISSALLMGIVSMLTSMALGMPEYVEEDKE